MVHAAGATPNVVDVTQDSSNDPGTEHVEKDVPEPDSESDPALDDTEGGEWADEGGAPAEGPATDTDDA